MALFLECLQEAANARVRVLDIVDRVLAILAHGEAEVEFHLRVGLGVEEVTAGVDGNFIEQVRKGDGLARALGHTHDLAVAHELDELHQHDIEAVGAVKTQRVHRALHTGHMAVMVRAPDVDDLVEMTHGELVAVVGNVAGEVGVEPVGAAQHVVLEVELVDVLVLLALLAVLLTHDLGGLEPERAFLFVGPAELVQLLHRVGHKAAVVQAGFEEPLVEPDAVALKIALHFRNVALKAERRHVGVALLDGLIKVTLAVKVVEGLGKIADIVAVVAVLGELNGVLAADELDVARLDALGKLFDLVAEVVDVELAPDLCPRPVKHLCERIAEHAAAGVAHVHGAGGVRGDELDHILLAVQPVVAAVVFLLFFHGGDHVGIPLLAEAEVQKAGACDLNGGEVGVAQVHVLGQDLGDLAGILAHGLGSGQAEGRGIVAVGGILGDLHGGNGGNALGQEAFLHSRAVSRRRQLGDLVLCAADHIHSKFSSIHCGFTQSARHIRPKSPHGDTFSKLYYIYPQKTRESARNLLTRHHPCRAALP